MSHIQLSPCVSYRINVQMESWFRETGKLIVALEMEQSTLESGLHSDIINL